MKIDMVFAGGAAQSPASDAGGSAGSERAALTACFGVACRCRARCARYAAVDDSQASPGTLVTCAKGKSLPLFVEAISPRSALCSTRTG